MDIVFKKTFCVGVMNIHFGGQTGTVWFLHCAAYSVYKVIVGTGLLHGYRAPVHVQLVMGIWGVCLHMSRQNGVPLLGGGMAGSSWIFICFQNPRPLSPPTILFQVLPQVLPQMQPELPKECRESSRHASLPGGSGERVLPCKPALSGWWELEEGCGPATLGKA